MNLNSKKLPTFDSLLSDNTSSLKIRELALELKKSLSTVEINVEFLDHWEQLVKKWALDVSLPLYIRKFNDAFPRGAEIIHKSGRILIPCDNGPAQWAFSMCFNQNLISINELKSLILEDQIPIAMVLKGKEKFSKYKNTKMNIDNPNKKGWKIAHKIEIGLNTRTPLNEIDISSLQNHFIHFLNPKNIFLIPLKYAGLAEIDEVIKVYSEE